MAFGMKVALLLLTAFLVRPTALGENYSLFGTMTAFAAFLFHLLDCRFRPDRQAALSGQNRLVLTLTLMLFGYLLGHAMAMNSVQLMNVLKAMVTHGVVVTAAAFILSDKRAARLFFRSMVVVMLGFVLSYYVTVTISLFVPLPELAMFKMNIGDYERSGMTYFPFTVMYGVYTVNDMQFPRLLGLFREPGILQMLLIWALYNLKSIDLDKIWVKAALVLGIVATFSTAGITILFANLVVYFFIHKKWVRGLSFVCIAYLVMMYAPFIGIQDKTETHGASISDRTSSMQAGLEALKLNPMGIGMYNTDTPNAGINLIAASSMIGLIGVLLTLLVYMLPMLAVEHKKTYLLSVTPIVITSLVSQPLLDAPLLYLLLMMPFARGTQIARPGPARPLGGTEPIVS